MPSQVRDVDSGSASRTPSQAGFLAPVPDEPLPDEPLPDDELPDVPDDDPVDADSFDAEPPSLPPEPPSLAAAPSFDPEPPSLPPESDEPVASADAPAADEDPDRESLR